MTARIEWSPDSTRFAVHLPDTRIRLHAVDGALIRPIGKAAALGWADNDHILSIDDGAELRWHGPIGVTQQRRVPELPVRPEAVALAASISHCAYLRVINNRERELCVWRGAGRPWKAERALVPRHVECLELAASGATLAVTMVEDEAYGYVIFDIEHDLRRREATIRRRPRGRLALMLDKAGSRCVLGFGEVVEVSVAGKDDPPLGELAHAVAIDARGMIAVYARGGRLAFHFLSGERASATVAVEGELAYPTPLDEIVAMAFDPTSHWLACLDASGSIEVVPVP